MDWADDTGCGLSIHWLHPLDLECSSNRKGYTWAVSNASQGSGVFRSTAPPVSAHVVSRERICSVKDSLLIPISSGEAVPHPQRSRNLFSVNGCQ